MPISNLFVEVEKEASTLHLSLPHLGFCHLYSTGLLDEVWSDGTVQQLLNLCVTEREFFVSNSLSSNRLINALLAAQFMVSTLLYTPQSSGNQFCIFCCYVFQQIKNDIWCIVETPAAPSTNCCKQWKKYIITIFVWVVTHYTRWRIVYTSSRQPYSSRKTFSENKLATPYFWPWEANSTSKFHSNNYSFLGAYYSQYLRHKDDMHFVPKNAHSFPVSTLIHPYALVGTAVYQWSAVLFVLQMYTAPNVRSKSLCLDQSSDQLSIVARLLLLGLRGYANTHAQPRFSDNRNFITRPVLHRAPWLTTTFSDNSLFLSIPFLQIFWLSLSKLIINFDKGEKYKLSWIFPNQYLCWQAWTTKEFNDLS